MATPAQIRFIEARSVAYNLDPRAVIAIGGHEGLSGGTGDNNTSFGPFQLHAGGALPSSVWAKGADYARQWAWSPQGIDYALQGMAKHAAGLTGEAAVAAISKFFERPADPAAEISDAMSHYGGGGGTTGMGGGTLPTGSLPPPDPGSPVGNSTDLATSMRQQALGNLNAMAQGEPPKSTDELASLATMMHSFGGQVPTIANAATYHPSSLEGQAVKLAQKYIGVKYTWGGTNAVTGFDCSGLVQTVWKQLGVDVPRTTYAQWDAGKPVQANQLKAGDAVFFTGSDPKDGKPGHEGLYIGNGKFIEAPGSGQVVHISNLAGRSDFVGARRFA